MQLKNAKEFNPTITAMDEEKALRFLLEQTEASEYTDVYDDCRIAWNVIASIMESYAKERAVEFAEHCLEVPYSNFTDDVLERIRKETEELYDTLIKEQP